MARRLFEFDPTTPYHVSSRCINREWFGLSMDQVWDLSNDHLYFVTKAYDLKVYSFVLMQNHFHLIAQAPLGNMSEAMAYFLRETSKDLTRASGRINRTWGGRFFRSRLGSYHYGLHAYKYVYQNPIRAQICQRVEQYKYSTLPGLLGLQKLKLPLEYDSILFDNDLEWTLKWLNELPSTENNEVIRKALRKKDFQISKVKTTKGPHSLEVDLL
jgi:REP element-mobilizing transposase RayT